MSTNPHTRVVAVIDGHPRWGSITVEGVGESTPVEVLFDHDNTVTLVARDLVHKAGPTPYPDDGIGDHYWRKDQEVHAEWLAHQAKDPATRGSFRPVTYID